MHLQPGASVYWKRSSEELSPPHWRGLSNIGNQRRHKPQRTGMVGSWLTKAEAVNTGRNSTSVGGPWAEFPEYKQASGETGFPKDIWSLPAVDSSPHLWWGQDAERSQGYWPWWQTDFDKSVWEFSLTIFVTQFFGLSTSSLCSFPSDLGPDTWKVLSDKIYSVAKHAETKEHHNAIMMLSEKILIKLKCKKTRVGNKRYKGWEALANETLSQGWTFDEMFS